ncbi:MAG: bifunctional (p)ppGpp synthetase/guanosine-3',5'-bis(diphosphate) 3'-pyrophosphohydrolase [Alphaproteobacteria bacterium]|nr:MAG: bifunctional (p)ppGpp synthetase/guanosine-3',5'-bis(diphosphate) 3'-pyrophosphohydrolase [Alphaproteobacteria bacterium]
MISADELVALVQSYNPATDAEKIRAAYAFGEAMHAGQTRRSGEPYFTHPVAVAKILAEQRLDDASIITALLHDTIEDTRATYSDIATRFGDEVAQLVDGVSKLTNLQFGSLEAEQAENFRKLLLAMSKDLRVLLVKLADRLHNMRTIRHMPPEKQVQKARETMDIYAPLAGRMGMQSMREELEDLAFRVLNPEARNSILRRFLSLRKQTGDLIPQIKADIEKVLAEKGISAEVTGREKKPYSIWRKMQEKKEGFSRLSDIYGFRIITETEDDCYRALGAVHHRWRAVPGRFKDYISQPKGNGYRSIHTTVSGRDGKRVEIQIRTRQMHDVAEAGVAAHWSYRDGVRVENPFAVDPFQWLRNLTAGFEAHSEDHEEFLEHMKLEMFADQVFCFTPKGEVVKLPRGATPLDFAYAIHTNIGAHCVGAKVDGVRVPLWTRLRNGQSVEIITAEGQHPQPSWMDIAVTGRARAAIRRALRQQHRERYIRLGRELARVAFERVGKKVTQKALDTAAQKFGLKDGEEVLVRLGGAEITGEQLVRTLYPELWREGARPPVPEGRALIGLGPNQTAIRARCCQPLPGERIVGITHRGRGVQIHAIDCAALAEYEEQSNRWIDVRWADGEYPPKNEVTIDIVMANDAGVLGRICTLIGEQNANISDMEFVEKKPDFYRIRICVEVRDIVHLHNLLTSVQADSDVAEVARVRDPARSGWFDEPEVAAAGGKAGREVVEH